MEEIIHVPEEQSETGNLTEYTESVVECFDAPYPICRTEKQSV